MYKTAEVVWFDALKGIGEAKAVRSGEMVFINASKSFKNPIDAFKLKQGVMVFCKTKIMPQGNLFGTKIKIV